VDASEIVFGLVLVLGLLGLSGYFAVRQVMQLLWLRQQVLPDEERRYERRKAWRRLVGSGMTLVLAGLLAVLLPYYQEVLHHLPRPGEPPVENPSSEQKLVARVYIGGWIVLLLVLLALLALAAVDLLATRLYGLRQYRKLQADRRAMIERQANRMRRDRNGHTGEDE